MPKAEASEEGENAEFETVFPNKYKKFSNSITKLLMRFFKCNFQKQQTEACSINIVKVVVWV